MKLFVISHPSSIPNEHKIINSLFEEGLEFFHIHKPCFSKKETKNFIQQIPSKYHSRIALHSDFPKFHSLQELKESSSLPHHIKKGILTFLSPIFDSISKQGYKSKFNLQEIKSFFQKRKVLPNGEDSRLPTCRQTRPDGQVGGALIALGGIDEDKIEICRETGFAGVAVLGAIWNNKNPLEKFKRIQRLCHEEHKLSFRPKGKAPALDFSLRSE